MNTKTTIIGLGGTNGSGKDSFGHILADDYGYLFISVTDLLRAEAKRRNQPVEREVLRTISAEWRRESGLGVLMDKGLAEFEKEPGKYKGIVMASLRNPGEADRVHELGGTVVWLDADPKIRYERIQANTAGRTGRKEEDNKTFEQFLAEEEAEMHHSGDEATLNMAGVKDRSDLIITNDSNDMSEFKAKIAEAISL